MADVRVAVIGVAGIGQAHLFAAPAVDGMTLAGVFDVDAERAAKAATDHSTIAFATYETLCTSGEVDAVVIATPPATHVPLVRDALRAGLHVYCEKPFAPTVGEGLEMARLAEERGRVVQVGLQFRHHHGYAAARRYVTSGEIGEVFRANIVATNWFRAQRYFEASPWRSAWRTAGGGVLLTQAIHQIDALLTMVGMPSRVRAQWYRANHDAEVEDEVVATLEWPNGARGTLSASLNDPAGHEVIDVHGDRGAVQCAAYDVRHASYESARRTTLECPDEFPETAVEWEPVAIQRKSSEWFDMMTDCHRDFVAAVIDGRPAPIDAAEGTRVVEFVNALYLSAARGEPVELPLATAEYASVYEQLCEGSISVPGAPKR
jgi:UDP-N-acetyl-2-amino-2-deoxyglucuronate dehydrogenase